MSTHNARYTHTHTLHHKVHTQSKLHDMAKSMWTLTPQPLYVGYVSSATSRKLQNTTYISAVITCYL